MHVPYQSYLLIYFCHFGVIDMMDELKHIDVNISLPSGHKGRYHYNFSDITTSPLWHAAFSGNLEVVEKLLSYQNINVNKGESPLAIAANLGYIDILKRLLQHPTIEINKDSMVPLKDGKFFENRFKGSAIYFSCYMPTFWETKYHSKKTNNGYWLENQNDRINFESPKI